VDRTNNRYFHRRIRSDAGSRFVYSREGLIERLIWFAFGGAAIYGLIQFWGLILP